MLEGQYLDVKNKQTCILGDVIGLWIPLPGKCKCYKQIKKKKKKNFPCFTNIFKLP